MHNAPKQSDPLLGSLVLLTDNRIFPARQIGKIRKTLDVSKGYKLCHADDQIANYYSYDIIHCKAHQMLR